MDVQSVSFLAKAVYNLVTSRLSCEQSCLVHAYLSEAIYRALPVGIRLDVTQHLCFQATIFGALSCFIHERLICENLLAESRANHGQLLLQISRSRKCKNSGTLKQFGPIFSKKRAKIKIQEQFSVRFTSQTNCLLMNMSRDVSRTHITVWLFNYPRNLVFFQPEVQFGIHYNNTTQYAKNKKK